MLVCMSLCSLRFLKLQGAEIFIVNIICIFTGLFVIYVLWYNLHLKKIKSFCKNLNLFKEKSIFLLFCHIKWRVFLQKQLLVEVLGGIFEAYDLEINLRLWLNIPIKINVSSIYNNIHLVAPLCIGWPHSYLQERQFYKILLKYNGYLMNFIILF